MTNTISEFFNQFNDNATITIYTDGACSKNPGPGGWGAVLVLDEKTSFELSGKEAQTTNNRMEMMAAVEALLTVQKHRPSLNIKLYTDSKYVKDGITAWIKKWSQNNWQTATGTLVKNKDLWESLDTLNKTLKVEWQWVKGHSGEHYNEIADTLARKAIISQVING
ncbi:MAG: Ribonuclease HI [Holosporales bacterium]